MWISSCLTFWKISLFVCLYPLQRRSSINALHPLRLFYPHLCVPWLISFSANFITITQMILHTGVSKNAFQMRSFLTSKCVYPQCLETGLFIWHSKSDQLTGWVQMVQSYEPCKWYQITFSFFFFFRVEGCQQNSVCAFWFAREVWITLCSHGSSSAGVCLLKGPIDRPEAWAFPAERLLTAPTVLWGAACQQLPLSIKQRLQVSTASGGEQGSSWRWGGTNVPPLALSNIFPLCCLITGHDKQVSIS